MLDYKFYYDFKNNEKGYSFLNHFVLNYSKENQYLVFSAFNNTITSISIKQLFGENWSNVELSDSFCLFTEKEVQETLNKFMSSEGTVGIDDNKTSLYNAFLLSLQSKKTYFSEEQDIAQYCLVIDDSTYLLCKEDNKFSIYHALGERVYTIETEDEFLYTFLFFLPILLKEKQKSVMFDGFELGIITVDDYVLLFNGNDSFYVLKEKESIEQGKYNFVYIEKEKLDKDISDKIQNIIKKERNKDEIN